MQQCTVAMGARLNLEGQQPNGPDPGWQNVCSPHNTLGIDTNPQHRHDLNIACLVGVLPSSLQAYITMVHAHAQLNTAT
jgi:hypothetical protein